MSILHMVDSAPCDRRPRTRRGLKYGNSWGSGDSIVPQPEQYRWAHSSQRANQNSKLSCITSNGVVQVGVSVAEDGVRYKPDMEYTLPKTPGRRMGTINPRAEDVRLLSYPHQTNVELTLADFSYEWDDEAMLRNEMHFLEKACTNELQRKQQLISAACPNVPNSYTPHSDSDKSSISYATLPQDKALDLSKGAPCETRRPPCMPNLHSPISDSTKSLVDNPTLLQAEPLDLTQNTQCEPILYLAAPKSHISTSDASESSIPHTNIPQEEQLERRKSGQCRTNLPQYDPPCPGQKLVSPVKSSICETTILPDVHLAKCESSAPSQVTDPCKGIEEKLITLTQEQVAEFSTSKANQYYRIPSTTETKQGCESSPAVFNKYVVLPHPPNSDGPSGHHLYMYMGPLGMKDEPEALQKEPLQSVGNDRKRVLTCQPNSKTQITTDEDERPFKCEICEKGYPSVQSLDAHGKVHTTERPHECEYCHLTFRVRQNLITHVRTHTGEKPHICPDCGRRFRQQSTMVRHRRAHTGERPYVCRYCGRAFSQRHVMVSHTRIHTGEKPFLCAECGKTFKEQQNLSRHARTHTGERPYRCEECGLSFTQKIHLVRHSSVHKRKKHTI